MKHIAVTTSLCIGLQYMITVRQYVTAGFNSLAFKNLVYDYHHHINMGTMLFFLYYSLVPVLQSCVLLMLHCTEHLDS